jgi:hypothetical protein
MSITTNEQTESKNIEAVRVFTRWLFPHYVTDREAQQPTQRANDPEMGKRGKKMLPREISPSVLVTFRWSFFCCF